LKNQIEREPIEKKALVFCVKGKINLKAIMSSPPDQIEANLKDYDTRKVKMTSTWNAKVQFRPTSHKCIKTADVVQVKFNSAVQTQL